MREMQSRVNFKVIQSNPRLKNPNLQASSILEEFIRQLRSQSWGKTTWKFFLGKAKFQCSCLGENTLKIK